MFGSQNVKQVIVSLDYDPAADDTIPVWIPYQAAEILSASATVANDVAADATNRFAVSLQNGGTDGTGTDAIAAAVGGAGGWTGNTPKPFTISEGTVDAGEVIQVVYDENGTGTFGQLLVVINYVDGVGA